MASRDYPFSSEAMANAMATGLDNHIREALRKRILEFIQPDIDAAVEAGLKTFEAAVRAHRDMANNRDVLEILIRNMGGPK